MSRPSSVAASHPPIAPTIPPALHLLANPPPTLLDAHLPNYLLPPALDLLRQSSAYVVRKRRAQEEELRSEGLLPPRPGRGDVDEDAMVEEELGKRIERIGLMVGGLIAEKLTLARPPLASHLDIIKFICKELFLYVYSRQIDNLRTNHRGVYVLQSHAFPPLAGLSSYRGAAADMEIAKTHLLFPQALVQGALTRLGMSSIVTAESSGLPQCTFQIRMIKSTHPTTPSVAGTPNPSTGLTARGHSAAGAGSVAMSAGGSASTGLGIGS
ncbi:hypothetical protein IAR50_004567 [Cryptococcus sp. DSM 104548]